MNWYVEVLKKYAVFSGRSRRQEYWFFILFNLIISGVLYIVDDMLGTVNAETGAGALGGIYSLVVLIPSIAVLVRRLHDTDRSGWWMLIGLIPLIGWIVLLVFTVQEGSPGQNRFGNNPKGIPEA